MTFDEFINEHPGSSGREIWEAAQRAAPKTLTIEHLQKIVVAQYGTEPGNWLDQIGFENCSWETAVAIHAALPSAPTVMLSVPTFEELWQSRGYDGTPFAEYKTHALLLYRLTVESISARPVPSVEEIIEVLKGELHGYTDSHLWEICRHDIDNAATAIRRLLTGEENGE